MKVLHLSSEISWRGGEQQIAYLIEELENLGVENIVACKKGSAFEAYCTDKEITHLSLSFRSQYDLLSALYLKQACRYFEVDLMHLHSSFSHGLGVLSSVLGNSTPLVLSRRVDFPIKNNLITQYKYNHPAVKRIICVSKTIENIVRQSVKKPERCLTVYSGIDLNKFSDGTRHQLLRQEYSIPMDSILIGNISAIAPHKDYYTFVDTAHQLIMEGLDAYFFIIGDGPLRADIESYIVEKGQTGRILLTGFRNDIPKILPELDYFLITSKTEGLGTTVLDAFACKVPVVATKGGGITETVIAKETGLLAEVGDAKGLADNIQLLINDQQLKEHLINNAFRKVQSFSKENMAKETYQVYKSIYVKKHPKDPQLN